MTKREDDDGWQEEGEEFLEDATDAEAAHKKKNGTDGEGAKDEKGEIKTVIGRGEMSRGEPFELLRHKKKRVKPECDRKTSEDITFHHIFARKRRKDYNNKE